MHPSPLVELAQSFAPPTYEGQRAQIGAQHVEHPALAILGVHHPDLGTAHASRPTVGSA